MSVAIERATTRAESAGIGIEIPLPRLGVDALGGLRALGLPLLFGLTLVFGAALAMIYLSQASSVVQLGSRVGTVETDRARVQLRNDQLRHEIAQARSLRRIEADASARLGMKAPERVVFIEPARLPRSATLPTGKSPLEGLSASVGQGLSNAIGGVFGR